MKSLGGKPSVSHSSLLSTESGQMMHLEERRTGPACHILIRVHFTDSKCLEKKR